jgi:hypothetical protein
VQRLTPDLIRDAHRGLRGDQKRIVRQMRREFARIGGDAAVKKLGYLRTKIGKSDRKCEFVFVPQKHVRDDCITHGDTIKVN